MSTLSALPLLRDAMASQLGQAPTHAAAPSRVAAIARKIWRALERTGQLRARQQLVDLADQYEITDPALAQHMRQAAQRISEG
ncbi:MAG TPA: hypothetical protein VIP05_03375 [Burkholderiaceae bacterium]